MKYVHWIPELAYRSTGGRAPELTVIIDQRHFIVTH
jgi:hypothetical protein